MAKKQVIIISLGMEIGGAEKALLGLLQSLDYNRIQVDLFLFHHDGPLMKYIPKEVNILPEICEYTYLARPIIDVVRRHGYAIAAGRLVAKLKAKRYIKKNSFPLNNGVELFYSHACCTHVLPLISEKMYDSAISFLTPHCVGAERCYAKKKIAWIHTDYSTLKIDEKAEYSTWNAYDYIVSISDKCTEGFLNCFPILANKIVRIDNIHNANQIQMQALEKINVPKKSSSDEIIALSVGRFDFSKNFDNIPEICSLICSQKINLKWYLIGFGTEESIIRANIEKFGMQNNVIILGKKENPYPFMKACDIYIQPSRYEGDCVSVHEAQVLGKPVIITDYATASSQLIDGVDGIIVPMNNEQCANAIANLLVEKKYIYSIAEYCKTHNMDNKSEINKLYTLIT